MSENLFGLTVAADKGLDDLQCQRLLSENRRYQEVMLQYRCALKALESRLEILNEEFSLQHDSGFSDHAGKYHGCCRCACDLLFRGRCVLFGKVPKRTV